MPKMNLVAALEILMEESVSPREMNKFNHPYYGLRDERGWLTRYPKEECNAPRDWIETFLAEGGKLDSMEIWGINPLQKYFYESYGGEMKPAQLPWDVFTAGQAARFLKDAHCKRWDNVPLCPKELEGELDDDIQLHEYMRLVRGVELKRYFSNHLGIELSNTFDSLGRKAYDFQWQLNRLVEHFDISNKKHRDFLVLLTKYQNFEDTPMPWREGSGSLVNYIPLNTSIQKCLKDNFSFLRKAKIAEKAEIFYWGNGQTRSFFYDYEEQMKRVTKGCMFGPHENIKTLLGAKVALERGKVHRTVAHLDKGETLWTLNGQATSVGFVAYINGYLVATKKNGNGVKAVTARIRTVKGYNVAKICGQLFMWDSQRRFESHVEISSVRSGIEFLELSKTPRQEVLENLMETGKITFRIFRKVTGSCWNGTRNFLRVHAPFLYTLMNGYNSWACFLNKSGLADEVFVLAPEFVSKIEHRF